MIIRSSLLLLDSTLQAAGAVIASCCAASYTHTHTAAAAEQQGFLNFFEECERGFTNELIISMYCRIYTPGKTIISYKEKNDWVLEAKYSIGKKR